LGEVLKSRAVLLPTRFHGVRCLSAVVTASFLLFSCQPQEKNRQKQSPQKATSEPRQADTWERTRECAAQAERAAKRFGWNAGKSGWENHYSAKYERCFVAVDSFADGVISHELYDAFEGHFLASCPFSTITEQICVKEGADGTYPPVDCDICRQFIADRMTH
jgi:hypothetical protein